MPPKKNKLQAKSNVALPQSKIQLQNRRGTPLIQQVATQVLPKRGVRVAQPQLTDYRIFLNNHIVGKQPENLPQASVDKWLDVNLNTPQGDITNEIAKKFNNTNQFGIGSFKFVPGQGRNYQPNEYGMNTTGNFNHDNSYFNLNSTKPQPSIVGHELIHANDHQGDNLNASTWRNLETLNTNGGYQNFVNSVKRIQDKVDPSGGFKNDYPLDKNGVINQINQWRANQKKIQPVLANQGQANNWNNVFPAVHPVVNDRTTIQKKRRENYPFLLNYASEFPAFMSENLHNSWVAGQHLANGITSNPRALNQHERTFIDSTLGDMDNAYPAAQYPITNQHIQARRNSINLAKGGHVKNYAGGGYIMNNASYNPSPSSSLMQYMRPPIPPIDPNMNEEEMYDPTMEDMTNPYPSYAKGGRVNQHPSSLTEFIRQQGRNGDTVLAHINPIEAHILQSIGGSGTINPNTGLPEFFKKPKWVKKAQKWMAGSAGGGIGAVVGNMIMPGIGGVIGGALGGAAGSAVRGRKDYMQAGLRGAAMGAMLPTVAGLAGTGANAMGATNIGHSLTKYGNINAVLPSIGFGGESSGVGSYMSPAMNSMGGSHQPPMQYMPQDQQYLNPQNPYVDNRSFGDKFSGNMKDYFTQPGNLLTLGTAAAQYMGRPKLARPKTPEQLADEERRYRNASRMTAAEVEAEEELNAVRKNATKRHKDAIINQELANIGQLHRKVNSPEEYAQRGQWLEYYDNPQFTGERIRMKSGGQVHTPHSYLIEQETIYPGSLMGYIRGANGGQDDDVNAMLSNGEYVIDASTVADLGDGNNEAGARKLDAFREKIRQHKRGGSVKLPPKSKSLLSYMRG